MSQVSPARVVLLLAVALLVTAVLVPVLSPRGTREGPCLATGSIETVADLNTFMQETLSTPDLQGADMGASVSLRDGRRLFVFADTLRSTPFLGQGLVHNSMLVLDGRCARVVLPADAGAVIPDRGDVGYWPMSVVRLGGAGSDLVGVTLQRVRRTADPAVDASAFEVLGPSVAVLAVPPGGVPQLLGVRDLGPDEADVTRPVWGAATAVADGWLYLYGTARPPTGGSGFSLRVARVHPPDLLEHARWEYWDGGGWGSDAGAAVALIGDSDGVSQTLSVFTSGGTWYAVSKRGEFLGTDLTIWSAPAPTGPFVARSVVASIPSDGATGTLRYSPLAHPGLLPEPGSVVVSYSRNNVDLGAVLADPRLYRPRFLRVPLPD